MTSRADQLQGGTALPLHARALADEYAEEGYRYCPLTDDGDGYTALAPLLAGLIPATSAASRDRAA